MPIARNLNPKKIPPIKFKVPKLEKWMIWTLVGVALVVLVLGIIMLTKVWRAPSEKKDVTIETGDRPLPQAITLWVTADGGLVMRENPDVKSKQLYLIPNGTQLAATETQGDWYKVTYKDKTGWVNKQYVTTTAPAEDPTKNWNSYTNKSLNYSLRFPKDWVVQDYGPNPATNSASYVAFGPQLAATLNPAILPPVIVRTTSQTQVQVEAAYKSNSGAVAEPAAISSLSGTKITYNSSSGTQMTAYIVAKGTTTYIIEETGGYSDELTKIIASINLG